MLYAFLMVLLCGVASAEVLMLLADPLIHFLSLPNAIDPKIAAYIPYAQAGSFLLALALAARLEKHGSLSPWQRLGVYAVVSLGALAAALTANSGSVDLFYYIAYGYKLAVLHLSPYTPLTGLESDPIIGAIPKAWLNVPALYGPTAVLFFTFLAWILPAKLTALLLGFKLVWFGAFLLFTWLLQRLLKDYSFPFMRWLGLCGNPVLWMLCLRDAHTEMLILALFTACFLGLRHHKWAMTGFGLAALVSLKITLIAVVPFFALQAFNANGGKNWKATQHLLIAFIGYILPLYALFGGAELGSMVTFGMNLQSPLCTQVIHNSIMEVLRAQPLNFSSETASRAGRIGANILLAGVLLWLFARVSLRKTPFSLEGATAAALALVVFTRAWSMLWYIFWPALPLMLYVRSRKMIFLTSAFVLFYAIDNNGCTGVRVTSLSLTGGALTCWLYLITKAERRPQP